MRSNLIIQNHWLPWHENIIHWIQNNTSYSESVQTNGTIWTTYKTLEKKFLLVKDTTIHPSTEKKKIISWTSLIRHYQTSIQSYRHPNHWSTWASSSKTFMQLTDLKSKPHGKPILWGVLDRVIFARFYPPLVSNHHILLCLEKVHGPNHRWKILEKYPQRKTKMYFTFCSDCSVKTTSP